MRPARQIFLAAALLPAFIVAAAADDWKITRLSGDALVFHQGRWTQLRAGDVVADDAFVRTLGSGSLQFTRDRESIDVEPNTQIQIVDRKGKRFTTVRQYFGTVGVEANRENVKHFAVQTPFLAAVVKGTVFAVKTTARASTVAVTRGKVGVQSADHGSHADVSAGQTASVSAGHGVSVGHAPGTAAAAAAAAPSVAAAVAAATATAAAPSASASSAAAAAGTASAASAGTAGAGPGASTGATGAASGNSTGAAADGVASNSSGQNGSSGKRGGDSGNQGSSGRGHNSGNGDGDGGGHGHGDGNGSGHGHGDGGGHGGSGGR